MASIFMLLKSLTNLLLISVQQESPVASFRIVLGFARCNQLEASRLCNLQMMPLQGWRVAEHENENRFGEMRGSKARGDEK
jgi:hypothetical protein